MGYRFPFDYIKKDGARVYLYGAGKVGAELFKQLESSNKNIINLGFLDSFATVENTWSDIVRKAGVQKPDILLNAEFDYVVLACRYELVPEFCENLFKFGVPYNKILLSLPYRGQSPDVKSDWDKYYSDAEKSADAQFKRYIEPALNNCGISLRNVLDFPSGRGRISESLIKNYSDKIGNLICCDSNAEAIEFCEKRFSDDKRIKCVANKVDNWNLFPLDFPNDKFSFIFSWDAMVHFSYKWLDFYICEFYRMLEKGGFCFIHHSNFGSPSVDIYEKDEYWYANPSGRSNVSLEDIYYISSKAGFGVIEQDTIDWAVPKSDGITILKKN